jgi:hypothetical protein
MGYWFPQTEDAMRPDMAKVIVERPRVGGGYSRPKGARKRTRKGWDEGLPQHEGIKQRWQGGRKAFNEHLGPLRRFLQSNVGRPWDKVFAEISAHINVNSVVQAHIRTHLFEYVARHVVLIDGVPCSAEGGSYGRPLASSFGCRGSMFYVCPRTGLLRRIKCSARRRPEPKAPRFVRVDDTHQCRWMDGAWYLVALQKFPDPRNIQPSSLTVRDEVLGRFLTREQAVDAYGSAVYGVARRQLGKREMRQLPIPMDWQK